MADFKLRAELRGHEEDVSSAAHSPALPRLGGVPDAADQGDPACPAGAIGLHHPRGRRADGLPRQDDQAVDGGPGRQIHGDHDAGGWPAGGAGGTSRWPGAAASAATATASAPAGGSLPPGRSPCCCYFYPHLDPLQPPLCRWATPTLCRRWHTRRPGCCRAAPTALWCLAPATPP